MPRSKKRIAKTFAIPREIAPVTDDQWGQLEQARGQPILRRVREEIVKVTNDYITGAQVEDWQATYDEIRAVVRSIRSHTDTLRRDLEPEYRDHHSYNTAQWHAVSEIFTFLARDDWAQAREQYRAFLSALSRACTAVDEDISLDNRPVERKGDKWRATIRRLTALFNLRGLPSGVSKNVSDCSPATPFVRFIGAWQELLPLEYRRHTRSAQALASAIWHAQGG